MKCDNCYFYLVRKEGQGWCRRFPPSRLLPQRKPVQDLQSLEHVLVEADETCGEFKPREP